MLSAKIHLIFKDRNRLKKQKAMYTKRNLNKITEVAILISQRVDLYFLKYS